MKSLILSTIIYLAFVATLASCTKEQYESADPLQVHFDIAMQAQTRAAERFDANTYSAKAYLFKESTSGSGLYAYVSETSVTGNNLTIGGLQPSAKYRLVFLAIPRSQQPSLPNFTATRPSYTDAKATYVSGATPSNELFRHILSFTASSSISTQQHTVVLTRQNGALQIRLNNSDGKIRNVKLEVQSYPQMLLNDGTGGMVLSSGNAITLSRSERPPKTNEHRITVNVLPIGDITGKGRLTITHNNGSQTVYDLVSTSGRIPVYPNQITWITLDDDTICDDQDDSSSDGQQDSSSDGETSGTSSATRSVSAAVIHHEAYDGTL